MLFSSLILASAVSWGAFTTPNKAEETMPIGSYSNGCISGAVSAKLDHPYYQVIRQQNRRFYGDPSLVSFLDRLSNKTHDSGLPILLVGDMSMPRGGPFKGGHASHQMGLDVDVWFRMVSKPLSKKDLKKPWALTIVTDNLLNVNKYYNKNIYTLVRSAAEDGDVERIFVSPAIKKALCSDTAQDDDRSWLRKVRPWWGHVAHMHVRLACPKGSVYCEKQALPPKGDGCGEEVNSWLEGYRHPKPKPTTPSKPKPKKVLPEQCQNLLKLS